MRRVTCVKWVVNVPWRGVGVVGYVCCIGEERNFFDWVKGLPILGVSIGNKSPAPPDVQTHVRRTLTFLSPRASSPLSAPREGSPQAHTSTIVRCGKTIACRGESQVGLPPLLSMMMRPVLSLSQPWCPETMTSCQPVYRYVIA